MKRRRFKYGRASANLMPLDENTYVLSDLVSLDRRRGQAKGVMQQIVEFADDERVILRLIARRGGPNPQTGLDNDALANFYERFGFVREPRTDAWIVMARQPSQEKHAP